jgi:two-component system, OmpR family, alkaline phosphatase synthesis response regulator PhoP
MNNENTTILIVDDEPDIIEFMSYVLKKEGYQILTASNGREAIQVATNHKPDLILMDIMMPVMDGIEACRAIRDSHSLKNMVIAFLTAQNEDYSQIAGFDAGADDFISKPIKPRVLISRIKALLRRSGGDNDDQVVRLGNLVLNRETYTITHHGVELDFPRKEFELLSLLTSKPGKVFTREEIMSSIWGDDVVVGDRTIDVHIRKIREKLGDDSIRTIKGVGYKFDA